MREGNLSAVERRMNDILKKLLMTSPQKSRLQDVFSKFYVSDSLIANDLKILRQMLSQYHLELKRQTNYVWIEGKETYIRSCITNLLDIDDIPEFRQFFQSDQSIQKQDATFVSKQIKLIEKKMHSEIPYPYDVNLFSHLYILVTRYRLVGRSVNQKLQLETFEKEKLNRYQNIKRVCQEVVTNLNMFLNTELPQIEIYYLYQYLISSRLGEDSVTWTGYSRTVRSFTSYLIDNVTQVSGFRKIDKEKLFAILVKHIKPLMNRLNNNIKVKNSLLNQIQLEYPSLFSTVKKVTVQARQLFKLNDINDDEIGFIVVYFAQAVENMRPALNAMVVCTTGLGTAQLLQTKIEKRFSDLNIVELAAGRDLETEVKRHPEIDLIISTIRIELAEKIPTLVVSAMFTPEDQERLQDEIDFVRKKMTIQ